MRRRPALVAAALVAALGALPLVPGGAHAQTGVYRAVANADGMRVTVAAPNYLLVNTLVDTGAPTTQAVVDGLGDSRAFASYPYPGDTVVAAPGLVKGNGGPGALPEYPLIVQTSYPTVPAATQGSGPYTLKAASQEFESSSVANGSGLSGDNRGGFTESTARAARDDASGSMTAAAESTAEALEFGAVFRIGRVHSKATATVDAKGALTRSSELEVGEVTIAGLGVALTDRGLTLAGSSTPLPDTSPPLEVLAQNGLAVRYLAGFNDPDGVVAPGVEITSTQPIPGGPTVITTYTFGRTSAHAAPGSDVTTRPPVVSSFSDVGAPIAGSSPTAASPGPTPALPSIGVTPAVATPPTASAPRALKGAAALAPASTPGPDWDTFYLILVAGAAATLAGAQLIRLLAVRLAWTS